MAMTALATAGCAVLLAGCTAPAALAPPAATAAAQPPPPLPTYAAALGSGWSLTFNGTFPGTSLDTNVWGTCYPWQSPDGCTNFGNAEFEWYTPSQDQVSDGTLHLVPERAPTEGLTERGAPKEYQYRSGIVTTAPSLNFTYGYVQVVARIPYDDGLWPALWLLPSDERWPPEIDILEHYGDMPISYQHLHSADYQVQMTAEATANLSEGYHTFGLYWGPTQIIWYIDGKEVFRVTKNLPDTKMYILANVAVYQQVQSGWGSPSDDLDIQSVRVWQAKTYR
jgi:beta-glucanase (GH16 family)